jgi:Prokaryotic homologs of the JAB domain
MVDVSLSLGGDHHQQLRRHLFPGDGKEAAAIGLCGRRDAKERHKLLVREIHPVPYSVCTARAPNRIAWPVSWLDPLIERAERLGLSITKFHSHPADYRRFSPADDASDKELFAGIHGWIDRDIPHASAVMLADGSLFGRAIDSDGRMRPLRTIAVIGDDLWFWHADPVDVDETGVGRPTSAFGRRMMAELARLTAAVVGASGTGSIMIEQLYLLIPAKSLGDSEIMSLAVPT